MKSKHKFKKIICTLFLALTIGFCSLNLTALAAENTENSFNEKFEIHDKTAEEKYLNLIPVTPLQLQLGQHPPQDSGLLR